MVKDVMEPIGRMDGDSLPVSAFAGEHVDGYLRARRSCLREARRSSYRSAVERGYLCSV